MGSLPHLWEPLAAYPRWLVVTCLVLAAFAAACLLVRLAKWAVALAVTAAVLLVVLVAVLWLLG